MFDWLSNWFNARLYKPIGLDIVDMTWEPGPQIKENTLKIYVIKYKNEINSAFTSEYDARDSYRYSRAALSPDMRLFELEVSEDQLVELSKDSSVPLVTTQITGETATPSQ